MSCFALFCFDLPSSIMQLMIKLIMCRMDSLSHQWNETKKKSIESHIYFWWQLIKWSQHNKGVIKVLYHWRVTTCQLLKHYGGVISGKIFLLLHFWMTESNLTVQYISSSLLLSFKLGKVCNSAPWYDLP